jgi:hypothetical protein
MSFIDLEPMGIYSLDIMADSIDPKQMLVGLILDIVSHNN